MDVKDILELLTRVVFFILVVALIVVALHLSKNHKKGTTNKEFIHPELLPGEMWLINIWMGEETCATLVPAKDTLEEEQSDNKVTFEGLPYKSKRLGSTAYTTAGFPLTTEVRPVFVSITEYHEYQKLIQNL